VWGIKGKSGHRISKNIIPKGSTLLQPPHGDPAYRFAETVGGKNPSQQQHSMEEEMMNPVKPNRRTYSFPVGKTEAEVRGIPPEEFGGELGSLPTNRLSGTATS